MSSSIIYSIHFRRVWEEKDGGELKGCEVAGARLRRIIIVKIKSTRHRNVHYSYFAKHCVV